MNTLRRPLASPPPLSRWFLPLILLLLTPCSAPAADVETAGHIIGAHYKDTLAGLVSQDPADYAAAYYLGLVYLQEGKTAEAAGVLEQCLAHAPESPKTVALKERLLLLKMDRARAEARELIEKGPGAGPDRIPETTVAVLNFNMENLPGKEVVSKGLAAMIITDLSQVPGLTVVEREKIEALQEEARLAEVGLVDPKKAAYIGELLMAGRIVRGRLAGTGGDTVEAVSSVVNTLRAEELGEKRRTGTLGRFFDMEKAILYGILETLGMDVRKLPKEVAEALNRIHTQNEEAFIAYSLGLDARDRGKLEEARKQFERALQLDPGFGLARDARGVDGGETASGYIENPGYFDYTGAGIAEKGATLQVSGMETLECDRIADPFLESVTEIPPSEQDTDVTGPPPAFPETP